MTTFSRRRQNTKNWKTGIFLKTSVICEIPHKKAPDASRTRGLTHIAAVFDEKLKDS